MRRTLIFGVLLVFVVLCAMTLVIATRRPVDEGAVAPVTLKFTCAETPTTDDFQQFWLTFRTAVETDDKDKLYALTTRCAFVWWNWWRYGLDLRSREFWEAISSGKLNVSDVPGVNARLVFQSKQEFLDSYPIIFSAETKRRLTTGTVTQTADGAYDIRWRDDGLNYLSFRNVAGVGYKFMGNDWEP